MLLAMALAVGAPVVAAPAASTADDDIVVTAARLRKIRVAADTDAKGRVRKCQVTISSGDPVLDRMACEATRDCAKAGIRSGRPVGDCVDQRMIAFANARQNSENENHAQDR